MTTSKRILGDIVTDIEDAQRHMSSNWDLMEAARAEIMKLRKQLVEETEINFQDRRYQSGTWKRLISEKSVALRERDEARREVCEITMPCDGSQKGYAKGRGWDCCKEEEHNA